MPNNSATMITTDANEAVASVAYRLSEVIAIYPITPASPMGEHADEWSAAHRPNLWGATPDVIEMQSEAGASGAVHGALLSGALATTFTASQGLLLMLPNMYKIAGELTPACLHVAARSIATHGLSIFGDHADVMATRQTGWAMLASGSPQEAQDLAVIAHAATLRSRLPFVHFFDGFRTSHEIQKIEQVTDDVLHDMIDTDLIAQHRHRALSPNHPTIRGTAHNPDTFFQAREAANPFVDACPDIVAEAMHTFGELTGRHYQPFDYVGHPQPERLIVMMGSGAESAHETVDHLVGNGQPVGLVKVRLYRPFDITRFLATLPPSVQSIAVLDRTKEPGATAEPLFLDVAAALLEGLARGQLATMPRLIGGRYGLSSKEFTPAMVTAVFDELNAATPKTRFTVGINDDVTWQSLTYDDTLCIEADTTTRAVFYGLGADGTVSSNKAAIKIIGDTTDLWCQGHFVYDSKKSGSTTVSYLRFGPDPIRSTYLTRHANFVAIHDPGALQRLDVLAVAAPGATVLLNTPHPPDQVWQHLPQRLQQHLVDKQCTLFAIDASAVAEANGLNRRINTIMSTCFFALSGVLPKDEAIAAVKESVEHTWGRRGPEIVRRNIAAIDAALAELHQIELGPVTTIVPHNWRLDGAPDFVTNVTKLMLDGNGDLLPVSAFPPDGAWPTGTGKYEKRSIATDIPIWESDLCVQCNRCAMICPHAAIRTKVFEPDGAANAPASFVSMPEQHTHGLEGLSYVVQVAPDDCTGCGLCVEVCPAKDKTSPKHKAINMLPIEDHRSAQRLAWSFFTEIPEIAPERIPVESRTIPLREPLFEFSGACAGCGETPYLKLLTQVVGDRLVIANATGCSSIYGANLPTTPYTTNAQGRGPAWANSLFEDNAEFGLGMRLAVDAHQRRARQLLRQLAPQLSSALVDALLVENDTGQEAVNAQRQRVTELRAALDHLAASLTSPPASTASAACSDLAAIQELTELADHLVGYSMWIVGGDGWAYDIGYGGLDHVLSSNRNINVLVLDTEVYSNTGGQQSKATPMGAVAKFASAGKESAKKDLGHLAMTYGHVYVASVAIQSRSHQTLKAFTEAESFPGPSIIIAHSPCIAHGYDLAHSPAQQKLAIDSGAWPLYRYDPRRIEQGEPPLHIDADPVSVPMRTYMREEARFRMVELRDPQRFDMLVHAAEHAVAERHAMYEQLAKIRLPQTEQTHD